MGFRSEDWAGHHITSRSLSSIHFLAFLEVCFGSLSYWKYCAPSSISNFSKLSITSCSKISQYCSTSILPCTSINISTPFQPIHPHIIRLLPPPCFTVGVVVQSDTASPCFFHTYIFPSDPILFIFVSSVHNILLKSSTVQFACSRAHFNRHCWCVFLSKGTFHLEPA